MMNAIHKLVIAISFLFALEMNAQCPTIGFSAPDSACKGTSVLFSNTSTGSNLSYSWDFNAADTRFVPAGGITGTYPAEIATSTGIDFMKENNNYIGFNLKSFASFVRIEYGNSLSNTPVFTSLGDLGGMVGSGNQDFILFYENGNYYGLINTVFGQLTRVSFGNSLLNTPTATAVTLPPGLFASPSNMALKKMGNDVIVLIANISGGNVTVINFGTSITNNTPAGYNIAVPGTNPITTALVNDCGHMYGYVAYVSASPITIIDFGNAVTSTPVQISDFTFSTQYAYRKINMINEAGNWILHCNTYGGELFHAFHLGTNAGNTTPIYQNQGTIGAFGSGFWTYAIKKNESEIGGIACNYNTGELSWFKYPQIGNVNSEVSSDENPMTIFNDSGNFVYSLTITDTVSGFATTFRDSIYISEAPSSSFTSTAACTSAPTSFASTSTGNPNIYDWDFGDGQTGSDSTLSNIYTTLGNYDVTLISINSSGCSDTATSQITVNDPPVSDFLFANNSCAGAAIVFTDNSTTSAGSLTSWSWVLSPLDTLTGPQVNYSYNSDGLFPVQLFIEASTGCIDSTLKYVNVVPGPIVSFSVSNTCLGDTVDFTNSTVITGGINIDYVWNFTSTDTSSLVDPTFAFSPLQAGDYSVVLTATATNGCIDTMTDTIHIGPPATTYFHIDDDTICANSGVVLTDSSSLANGETVIRRTWDFGDGQSDSLLTTISHTYATAGTYFVTLTLQTKTNCTSSLTKTIHVISSPEADFSFTDICEGGTAEFVDLSLSGSSLPISNWSWAFGDTNTSVLQNPMNQYTDTGNYSVALTVSDNNGCSDTISKTIIVYPNPTVYFSTSKACTYNEITFTDSSTISSTQIIDWTWNFGDGTIAGGVQNPQHIFTQSASYPVQLIAITDQGCRDSIIKLIAVDESPEFQLLTSKACYGNPNSFNFTPIGSVVTNPGYNWDFGDSTASLQAQPSHTYTFSGLKTVVFTYSNLNNGCSLNDTLIAEVIPNPVSDFITDSTCLGDTIFLNDNSSSAIDPINQWKWKSTNFPVQATLQNQSILTTTAGIFTVQLEVISNYGCKDSINKNVVVFALPQTSFTTDPDFGSPPHQVTFTNTSDSGSYAWNFGDGSPISTNTSPLHVFSDTGTFTIHLITTSDKGCIDSAQSTVLVLLPYLDIAVESSNYLETGDAYEVTATFRNLGNITIENFDINAFLQSKSPVSEYIDNISILPGNQANIKLKTRFLKDASTPEFICVKVTNVNHTTDALSANNEDCSSTAKSQEILGAYPNPNDGIFTIPVNSIDEKEINIQISDVYGQFVREAQLYSLAEGFNRLQIDISDLSSGSYILSIIDGEDTYYQKIIKR